MKLDREHISSTPINYEGCDISDDEEWPNKYNHL